ncbi:MAG: PAS domain-containing protein [Firmicutes bacterium]|uniref:protein-glutamate O-methyltransferase n=1 Tax=Candidatus Scybalomonas excrementavium TaxID=2840943 RepID=A0A9D9N6V1_9FIRM|nr:PAS domain-containing protein [Candidatus Scybalomonas excrementavium]
MKEEQLRNLCVAGIGASAGGVEALQTVFQKMPSNAGIAYIVVQHLSPDYKSYMQSLLERCTDMPIIHAENEMEVEPNTVYLNSPGYCLEVEEGKFKMTKMDPKQMAQHPIDMLFRSIANCYQKYAIGIVLSGCGADGSLGIRAIKEANGMVMAQDTLTAQFESMPRSSIATGAVDYILSPEEMGQTLLAYREHPYVQGQQLLKEVVKDQNTMNMFTEVLKILKEHSGVDFTYYKETTILRRLERRVSINRCKSMNEYYTILCNSEEERTTLFKEMLIGVTSFFRDKEAFASLEKNVIPKLDYKKSQIRVWNCACSTGEEVYSIAILLAEYIEENNLNCSFKIFATDVDPVAVEIAGRGVYSENAVSDIPTKYVMKYFVKKGEFYQIKDSIRNNIVFAVHNLLRDPVFSNLDLLICRNLFIYLKIELQKRVLESFCQALNGKGYLFMGCSESIGEMSEAFETLDSKWKIYRMRSGFHVSLPLWNLGGTEFGFGRMRVSENTSFTANYNRKIRMDHLMERAVSKLLPPAVLIDESDNILQVISNINHFLDLKPGKFTNQFLSILPNDLSIFVNSILRKLKRKEIDELTETITGLKSFPGEEITITGKRVNYHQVDYYLISLQTVSTKEKGSLKDVMDSESLVGQRIEDLERELQASKESLHATVEELETSNEELQSTNEELIASNEELQSTNEELQSVNEELHTVNAEYRMKLDELTGMTEDMDNLLVSAEIGALYLDQKLRIRKITPIVKAMTNLVESDIGRSIFHVTFMEEYSQFHDDLRYVIESSKKIYRYLSDKRSKCWLIRIQPSRSEQNMVNGIILTMVDTTASDNYYVCKGGKKQSP